MIEYFAYNVFLIIFFKFDAFKKYRESMEFRSKFLLVLITLVIFVMSSISLLKQNTILGLDVSNYTLRKIMLLLYFGTMSSIWAYLISDYFRKQCDTKEALSGPKGDRGFRGLQGNKSVDCDKRKCNTTICDNKILKHISDFYSKVLIENGKPASKHYTITNHFIQNKIKLLCNSNQLENILESREGNRDKVYNHINETWEKWIRIIMQYKNGQRFLDNQDLTDNDFHKNIF